MPELTSSDGTVLSYARRGDGAAVVLVGGGLDDGAENAPLADELGSNFDVVNYSRRGRGGSGDVQPYALEREIDDLAALIDLVGGSAHLFGASSGGALVLEAAAAGLPTGKLAVYDVPYSVGDDAVLAWQQYVRDLHAALDRGRHDEALGLFMRLAGSSEQDIAAALDSPSWPGLRDLVPTLRYDAACLGDGPPPADRLGRIRQPTLVATGAGVDPNMAGLPMDFFGQAADATAAAIPNAERLTIDVYEHVVNPKVLAPVLANFYRSAAV